MRRPIPSLVALLVLTLGPLASLAQENEFSVAASVVTRGEIATAELVVRSAGELTGLEAEIEHDTALCAYLHQQELRPAGRSRVAMLDGVRCPASGRLSLFALDMGGDGAAPGTAVIPPGDGPIATWSFRVATDAPVGPHPLTVRVLQARNGPLVVPMTATAGVLHIRSACTGDCNGEDEVTVDEIITGVSVALGNTAVETCYALDANDDAEVTVDEIITAVNHALNGCPDAAAASAEIEP